MALDTMERNPVGKEEKEHIASLKALLETLVRF